MPCCRACGKPGIQVEYWYVFHNHPPFGITGLLCPECSRVALKLSPADEAQ